MKKVKKTIQNLKIIKLPLPKYNSNTSIEQALLKRRSVRNYKDEPTTIKEISQLLWAAQGITSPSGLRAAPSAGALYPLELYIVSSNVTDLPVGIYKYRLPRHELVHISKEDKKIDLANAAFGRSFINKAAVVIVFSAVYQRTTIKYGQRGIRYVHMDIGHAAQNIYLQAVSLGLGTVAVGSFDDDEIKKIVGMPDEEQAIYMMPVGRI